MNWSILGIDETKDKKAITRAYREKLSLVNPEEKPEEFMALREAYDTALKLADLDETESLDEYEGFRKDLESLYNDFKRRIDVSAWKNLLTSDISTGLDSRQEIEDILITFFLGHYRFPKIIWEYLNEEYNFLERIPELKEKYPKDFVDYIIVNGCKYKENIPYELFSPGLDGQEIDQYLQAFVSRRDVPLADASEIVEKLSSFTEKHPYGDFYIAQYYVCKGQIEYLEQMDYLYQKYPDNTYILDNYAYTLFMVNQQDKAYEACLKSLGLEPSNYSVKLLIADILAKQNKFVEAVDVLTDLMYIANGDSYKLREILERKQALSDKEIEYYEAEVNAHPDSFSSKLDLGWAYIDKNDYVSAKEKISDLFDASLEGYCEFSFSNLCAYIATSEKDYEKALIYIDRAIKAIDNLSPDGTKKTDRALTRKNEFLLRKAGCYYETGQRTEAIEICRNVIKDDEKNSDAYKQIIVLLLAENLYNEAYEYAKHYEDLAPFISASHYFVARCANEVGDFRLAYDEINVAIGYDRSNLEFYLLKCRILLNTGNYDMIKETLKFLEDNNSDNLEIRFIEAQILRYHSKKRDIAMTEYKVIEKQLNPARDRLWISDFYYEYGSLIAELGTNPPEVGYRRIMTYMERAYALDSRKIAALEYKAWALYKLNRLEEALADYLKLYKLPNHPLSVTWTIAEIYTKTPYREYEKALDYYLEIAKEHEDDLEVLDKLGNVYYRLGKYEEALDYFKNCYNLSEGNIYYLSKCKMVLVCLSRFDEALSMINEAILEAKYTGAKLSDLYLMKANMLARENRTDEALSVLEENASSYTSCIDKASELKLRFCYYDKLKTIIKAKETSNDIRCHYYFLNASKAKHIHSMLMWLFKANTIYEYDKALASVHFEKLVHAKHIFFRSNGRMLRAAKSLKWFNNSAYCLNGDNIYSSLLMVEDYYLANKSIKAISIANELLNSFKNHDESPLGIEEMRRTYSAYVILYSILGDEKKAKSYLDSMHNKPRCNSCSYCVCCDEAIAKMFYFLSFGTKEEAFESIKSAYDVMPGDLFLASYMRWFKKKGLS